MAAMKQPHLLFLFPDQRRADGFGHFDADVQR